MNVELRLNPVEPLDDFVKAAVHVAFQIVEALVLGPLGDPYGGPKRHHDGQRDRQELERRVHPLRILPVPGAKAPPKASIVVL